MQSGEDGMAPAQLTPQSDPELCPLPEDLLDLSLGSAQDPPIGSESIPAEVTAPHSMLASAEDMETGDSYQHDSPTAAASGIYKIVGDNIDKKVRPFQCTVELRQFVNYLLCCVPKGETTLHESRQAV